MALDLRASVIDDFPARTGSPNSGRKREQNPFDPEILASYDAGGQIRAYGPDQVEALGGPEKAIRLARASAAYLDLGLNCVIDDDGNLVLRARDKRVVQRKSKAAE